MDRTGTQIDFDNVDTNPSSPTLQSAYRGNRNAPGTSKIRGIEADVTTNPVRGDDGRRQLRLYLYQGAGDAEPVPEQCADPGLRGVHAAQRRSAYVDYETPLTGSDAKLRFHLDGNYADPVYSFQNETTRTDKSFVMNGRIALADIPLTGAGTTMTVSLWSRNLSTTASSIAARPPMRRRWATMPTSTRPGPSAWKRTCASDRGMAGGRPPADRHRQKGPAPLSVPAPFLSLDLGGFSCG